MCINTTCRRPVIPPIKFRLRKERKRIIRLSKDKCHNIIDHEIGMRRFCLIRNTLKCLQREAREERLARLKAKADNISPSYLSISRPRSPSPPCDMEVTEAIRYYGQPSPSPISSLSDDEEDLPLSKRQKLTMFEEKENEIQDAYEDPHELLRAVYEDQLVDEIIKKTEPHAMDDTMDDTYEEAYEDQLVDEIIMDDTMDDTYEKDYEDPHQLLRAAYESYNW